MSEESDSADKEHEPSHKKLEDARKKGEIPRSADIGTAAAYLGFLLAATAFGASSLSGLGTVLMMPIGRADELATAIFGAGDLSASDGPLAGSLLGAVGGAMAPWILLPLTLALLAYIAQRGVVFAPTKLAPKFSRISPLQGFKNKFGRNGLFEFAKSTVKLLIYGTILGVFVWGRMPRLIGAMHLTPGQIAVELGEAVVALMGIVVVVAIAIGLVDLIWQHAEHIRKHRMSRKELKDEMKESDGDPMLKQQRRQKGISIAMNQMLGEVPNAAVVVVNPTHYAVALGWDRSRGSAPICLAKGTDELALKIREIATEHGVPIHSDPPTARALHASLDLGDEIEPEHYKAVAAAIRFADRLRKVGAARRGA